MSTWKLWHYLKAVIRAVVKSAIDHFGFGWALKPHSTHVHLERGKLENRGDGLWKWMHNLSDVSAHWVAAVISGKAERLEEAEQSPHKDCGRQTPWFQNFKWDFSGNLNHPVCAPFLMMTLGNYCDDCAYWSRKILLVQLHWRLLTVYNRH